MKNILSLAALTFLVTVTLHAQTKRFHTNLYLGYPLTGFDVPDIGYHISFNPVYRLNGHFSMEGQLSYSYAKFDRSSSALFDHNGGKQTNLNALVGLRVYLLGERFRVRPYGNALFGIGNGIDQYYNSSEQLITSKEGPGSVSIGAFLEIRHRLSIGISLEGPMGTLVPKIGYQF